MPKNDPEYQKNYQKAYRERKRAEKFPPIVETELPTVQVENVDRATDRADGLPRSNYFSNYSPTQGEKIEGGWTDTIQRMDSKLRDAILERLNTHKR
jgi:hypothetical protein